MYEFNSPEHVNWFSYWHLYSFGWLFYVKWCTICHTLPVWHIQRHTLPADIGIQIARWRHACWVDHNLDQIAGSQQPLAQLTLISYFSFLSHDQQYDRAFNSAEFCCLPAFSHTEASCMLQPDELAIHETFPSSFISRSSKTAHFPHIHLQICVHRGSAVMDFLICAKLQVSFSPFFSLSLSLSLSAISII